MIDRRFSDQSSRGLAREALRVLLLVVRAVVAGLDRLPPVAVLAVPLHRLGEAGGVQRVPRRPPERTQLGRVHGVAPVVPRPVGDVANEVRRRTGEIEDAARDLHVLALLAADVLDLAG